MKKILRKLATFKNFAGLFYIVFYFSYVIVNMFRNKGNYLINIILLILTFVYFIFYIYSVFIEKNKMIKRKSNRIFKRCRRVLGFVNACLILTSVISNTNNSFSTIFLAIATILWYILYLIVDLASSLALHEFKKYKQELGWKHDNRR
jgi:hypothetical protein